MSPGGSITGNPVSDYVLSALQHDAIRGELDDLISGHIAKDCLNPAALAASLRPLITEMLDAATGEDWQIVALCLIEDARESTEKRGHR